ncbi:MAG: AAA family ATPase [Candidatus Eremiobacteraeota bacterium]|nr:AAA family ATPase [Candidatus Eremiobacteraeota bacterium]
MILSNVRSRTLVGRDAELQLLRDTRRSLSNGRGGVVLLGGQAGIGKTRLLAAFTESLTGGRAPLFALGECLEHAPSAFGPVRQILDSLARKAKPATSNVPPLARRMLRTLVPEALQRDDVDADTGTLERAELFSGVLAYFAAIAAKRAVVLAIEDLHWADAASLELLSHIAARIAGMRIMIVATYRDDDVSVNQPLFGALARLTRIPNVTTASLEPLASGEMATLVLDALNNKLELASDRMHDIVLRSEGNPLFAEELLKRALSAQKVGHALPISIRAIILERLVNLDPEARRVLDFAALFGATFTLSPLALVAERNVQALTSIVDRLRDYDLIVADSRDIEARRFRFRHALTREAISGEIDPAEARRLHARIATLLAELPDADSRLDELAYHAWEGGLRVEACDFNERAGERAMEVRAPAHAATHFLRALQMVGEGDDERRIRLLGRAGAASSQACDFPASIASYTSLHDMQLARGNYDAAGVALLRAANDHANTNHGVEAMALLQTFLATYGAHLSEEATDHLNSSLAYLATTQEAHDLVPSLLGNVREPARMATHPHEAYWLAQMFTAERQLDRASWLAAVRAIRSRLDEAYALARGQLLHSIGQTALTFAENDEAERSLDEAIAFDREHGLTQALAFATTLKVRLLYLQGRLTEALPLIRFTLGNRDIVAVRTQLMMGAPHVALALGDHALARRCVDEEIFANTNEGPQVITNAMLSTTMAAWLESDGRKEEARKILDRAIDRLDRPFTDAKFWCLAASLVDDSKVSRLRGLCSDGAAQPGAAVMQATHPLVEAILARRADDSRAAREFAATASERFRRLGWPLFEAQALEMAGERDRASALFRTCESIADLRRLEMRLPVPTVTATQTNGLSVREREVAVLIARGCTNRAIAAELHISENTVEKHVTKIYSKLDFSTRAELAAYASRAGNFGLVAIG